MLIFAFQVSVACKSLTCLVIKLHCIAEKTQNSPIYERFSADVWTDQSSLDRQTKMEWLISSRTKYGPLLLDRSVNLTLFPMLPSFGYFSTVI